MKHRTLTRVTQHKIVLVLWATFFLIGSVILGILFALTLTSLKSIHFAGITLTVTKLSPFGMPLAIVSSLLLIFFIVFIIHLIIDKRKVAFSLSETSIEVHSRKASYTVELKNVDYLHLLRLPAKHEYGFRNAIALYEHKNFSWTIIGPHLRDQEDKQTPIGVIQQEIIEQFHLLKKQNLRDQLVAGQEIIFPYLAENLSVGIDTSQQEDFDQELMSEQEKGRLPVSQILPTGVEISWQGRYLTIDQTEIDIYDIADIQLHPFSKTQLGKKASLPWNYGQQTNLVDHNKTILATIYLPSLLNGEIFLAILLEVVKGE